MSIRTILVAAGGGKATQGAIHLGCRLAKRFEAHIEGLHVMLDPATAFAVIGDGFGVPPSVGLIETMIEDAKANAAKTRVVFDDLLARHEIGRGGPPQIAPPGPSAGWREVTGDAAVMVARRGRFFDLIVLGRSDRVVHEAHSDTIEEVLMRSARPVLLAPAEAGSRIGQVVAIAWNGSPQAVRALAASLPFLEKAASVALLTSFGPDQPETRQVLDYLAWHRINAEHRYIRTGSSRHIGEMLLDAAGELSADMLVMGGYGHAPWREFLFGGTTREALAKMVLPLLLVH